MQNRGNRKVETGSPPATQASFSIAIRRKRLRAGLLTTKHSRQSRRIGSVDTEPSKENESRAVLSDKSGPEVQGEQGRQGVQLRAGDDEAVQDYQDMAANADIGQSDFLGKLRIRKKVKVVNTVKHRHTRKIHLSQQERAISQESSINPRADNSPRI